MKTILIVENNPQVGELFGGYLRQLGYKVLLAASAEAAILKATVYQDDIHLLLTNVLLPDMNGKQLSQQLQITRPDMETVFISSSGYTELYSQGIKIPANRFLQKPFPLDRFTDTIQTLLTPHR